MKEENKYKAIAKIAIALVVAIILILIIYALVLPTSESWKKTENTLSHRLSIQGDSLKFQQGFSIALMEGVHPILERDGKRSEVKWSKKGVTFSLLFKEFNPQVELKMDFQKDATDLPLINGLIRSTQNVSLNFGLIEKSLTEKIVNSPRGFGTFFVGKEIQFSLPFLASAQNQKGEIRWKYFSHGVDDCKIPEFEDHSGRLRFGLPRIQFGLKQDTIVSVISSDELESDTKDYQKRLKTIASGFSEEEDPRFGNGGFASFNGRASVVGESKKDSWKASNLDFVKMGCTKEILNLQGLGVVRIPGSGFSISPDKSQAIRGLKKILEEDKSNTILHFSASQTSPMFSKEGASWTLSKQASDLFTDLELYKEDHDVAFSDAESFLKDLNTIAKIRYYWTPEGRLIWKCKECEDVGKFTMSVKEGYEVIISKNIQRRFVQKEKSKLEILQWDFLREGNYAFEFTDYSPDSYEWRFEE